jgi:trk system potassium uptake protein TrkH
MVFYLLGKILVLEAALMCLPLICSAIYGEESGVFAFGVTIALALFLGFILVHVNNPKDKTIFAKEGFVIVALAWVVMSLVGALPFTISGEIPFYINAVFETVSGFTTTGASILTNVEALSHGMLFWRSFTHWVGGMGILVLVMAIVPTDSGRSMHIARAEMPGPIIGKLVPKLKSTAKILYLIYICLTALQVVLLLAGGMKFFDSLLHSFGTAGTGGFGIKGDSIASYTPYQQWVIAIFMLIFGVNFNIYYLILVKKIRTAFKSEEFWVYIGIVAFATGLITVNVYNTFDSLSETVRHTFFQVSSVMTTTGYSTLNFNEWPYFSKGILLILMFIGACAGSTAGGLKVSRAVLLFKRVSSNLKHALHPRSTEVVRLEGKKVDDETLTGVMVYFSLYFLFFTAVFFCLLFEPFDLETNISAAASCFNNIGPAFGSAWANYNDYSPFSKIVLSVAMLAGRLEIYPMILLFSPTSWIKRRKIKK